MALRILILLKASKTPLSKERIYLTDFLSTYGKFYGLSSFNLHGDNDLCIIELSARKQLTNLALPLLCKNQYVRPSPSRYPPLFSLTEKGMQKEHALSGSYAMKYRQAVHASLSQTMKETEAALLAAILARFGNEVSI